ncbi:hypothetical protein Hypma_009800 [Hypsizygus marmoreus]|uniref:Uncharacterized protein n=1 Tax=Hypsizygus marmoreus TaxID=39966 RepID=A0A369JRF7_HYPMA|nr:hypothetical protein Hypma_009800 [Hypsizygus marmoreus]
MTNTPPNGLPAHNGWKTLPGDQSSQDEINTEGRPAMNPEEEQEKTALRFKEGLTAAKVDKNAENAWILKHTGTACQTCKSPSKCIRKDRVLRCLPCDRARRRCSWMRDYLTEYASRRAGIPIESGKVMFERYGVTRRATGRLVKLEKALEEQLEIASGGSVKLEDSGRLLRPSRAPQETSKVQESFTPSIVRQPLSNSSNPKAQARREIDIKLEREDPSIAVVPDKPVTEVGSAPSPASYQPPDNTATKDGASSTGTITTETRNSPGTGYPSLTGQIRVPYTQSLPIASRTTPRPTPTYSSHPLSISDHSTTHTRDDQECFTFSPCVVWPSASANSNPIQKPPPRAVPARTSRLERPVLQRQPSLSRTVACGRTRAEAVRPVPRHTLSTPSFSHAPVPASLSSSGGSEMRVGDTQGVVGPHRVQLFDQHGKATRMGQATTLSVPDASSITTQRNDKVNGAWTTVLPNVPRGYPCSRHHQPLVHNGISNPAEVYSSNITNQSMSFGVNGNNHPFSGSENGRGTQASFPTWLPSGHAKPISGGVAAPKPVALHAMWFGPARMEERVNQTPSMSNGCNGTVTREFVEQLEADRRWLRAENMAAAGRIEMLGKEIAKWKSDAGKRQAENEDLRMKIETLEIRVQEVERSRSKLTTPVGSIVAVLEAENRELRESNTALHEYFNAHKRNHSRLSTRIAQAELMLERIVHHESKPPTTVNNEERSLLVMEELSSCPRDDMESGTKNLEWANPSGDAVPVFRPEVLRVNPLSAEELSGRTALTMEADHSEGSGGPVSLEGHRKAKRTRNECGVGDDVEDPLVSELQKKRQKLRKS